MKLQARRPLFYKYAMYSTYRYIPLYMAALNKKIGCLDPPDLQSKGPDNWYFEAVLPRTNKHM